MAAVAQIMILKGSAHTYNLLHVIWAPDFEISASFNGAILTPLKKCLYFSLHQGRCLTLKILTAEHFKNLETDIDSILF